MNQLIWFSIPGTIFMAAWAFIGFPTGLDDEAKIALTLPIGFAIHQLFRVLFERRYGWHLQSRQVISRLKKDYKIENKKTENETRREAFIVWEMTLYSNKNANDALEIPESFRQHNRNSWHYVLSFWSCTFISILCAVGVYAFAYRVNYKLDWYWPLFSFCMICMGCAFWRKGDLTYAAINEQELAAVDLYKGAFDRIAAARGYKTSEVLEIPVNPRSTIWGLLLALLKI